MFKHLLKDPDIVIDDSQNRTTNLPVPGRYAEKAEEYCRTKCVVKAFMSRPDLAALREACAKVNRRVEVFTVLGHPLERAFSLFFHIQQQGKDSRALTPNSFFQADDFSQRSDWFQTNFNNSLLWQFGYHKQQSERQSFEPQKHCHSGEEVYECLHRRSLELLSTFDYVGSYENLKSTYLHLAFVTFPSIEGTWPYKVKFLLGSTLGHPYNHVLKHSSHLIADDRGLMMKWMQEDVKLYWAAMKQSNIKLPASTYIDFAFSMNCIGHCLCVISFASFLWCGAIRAMILLCRLFTNISRVLLHGLQGDGLTCTQIKNMWTLPLDGTKKPISTYFLLVTDVIEAVKAFIRAVVCACLLICILILSSLLL